MLRPLSALVCLPVLAFGAWTMLNLLARSTTTERTAHPGVRTLEVRDAGRVRLTGAPAGSPVVVTARITRSLVSPSERVTRSGGELELDSGCPMTVATTCATDYAIAVPPEVRVVVDARAGDVGAADLRSDHAVALRSRAGSVAAERVVAPALRARSSAGDVRLLALRAREIDADSAAGDVRVEAVSPVSRLSARSSAGDVDVVVPEGVYRLQAESGAGDVRAGAVRTDPASRRVLELRSSAGDVRAEVQTRR